MQKNIDNINLEEIDKKALFMALDITEADRSLEEREKEKAEKKKGDFYNTIVEILQHLEKMRKRIESHDEPYTMEDAMVNIKYILYYYWKL